MDLNHLNLRVRNPVGCRAFYEAHFGFRTAFEGEGGYFLRNEDRFLLALLPTAMHQPMPEGFHVGFGLDDPDAVVKLQRELTTSGVRTTVMEDVRPAESYVTFRCWDPDGTEIEVFWQAP